MITHPMRRFLTVVLLYLLAHPLIASGFITIDSQPIDISALPLGQSKEVLVFAGGPNCGFVKMTSSFYGGSFTIDTAGGKRLALEACNDSKEDNPYAFTLTHNPDGSYTLLSGYFDQYLPGWPSTTEASAYYAVDEPAEDDVFTIRFSATAHPAAEGIFPGEAYIFTAVFPNQELEGHPVQAADGTFRIVPDAPALPLQFFPKEQMRPIPYRIELRHIPAMSYIRINGSEYTDGDIFYHPTPLQSLEELDIECFPQTFIQSETGEEFSSPRAELICQPDREGGKIILTYFTQNEVDDAPVLTRLLREAFQERIGQAGYCDAATVDWKSPEVECIMQVLDKTDTNHPHMHPADHADCRQAFNTFAIQAEVVQPQPGKAYRLAFRSADCRQKWYLADGGSLTQDTAEAAIVVAGTGAQATEGRTLFAVSNANDMLRYLHADGIQSATYQSAACNFKAEPMATADGSYLAYDDPAHRFGTFCIQFSSSGTDSKGTLLLDQQTHQLANGLGATMNATLTSAVGFEEVDYPYTQPLMVYGGTGKRPDATYRHLGGFASIWLPFPMTIPEGIEIYQADGEGSHADESYVHLKQVERDLHGAVSSGGYILYDPTASENRSINIYPAPSNPIHTPVEGDFTGSTVNPTLHQKQLPNGDVQEGDTGLWTQFLNQHTGFVPYVLSNKSQGIGLYRYTGDAYPKGKIIYLSPAAQTTKESVPFFIDAATEGVSSPHSQSVPASAYDLQGRRSTCGTTPQIIIIGRQKTLRN